MSSDPNLRTTIVQAFAVTVQASGPPSGMTDPEGTAVSVRVSDSEPATSERGPSVLPEEGQIVGGLYRLMKLLGKGMFGKVYVAERVDVPEHRVALKLLPRSLYASRNVERELVMLATVGHPNVVQLKDHGMTADYVWLTMPVYQGETLGERLERGPLSLREAYEVFLPVARGLEALHSAGLRHQDVKPENIYLARFGGRVHPILLDLGVAAEREATFCAGTALYASPEQIRALNAFPGAVKLDEKMDTYCLAATLLVALAGPEHFPGERATTRTELEEAHAIRADQPLADGVLPDVKGKPRALLQQALKRWLSVDPKQRPTMAKMAEQLEVLLEPEREAAREDELFLARQRAALGRFRIAAAGLLLVAFAGALLMFSKRETLRLANELERTRREGRESFDKLDTCVASHGLAERRARDCQEAREQDRAELKQALAAIDQGGDATAAQRAEEMQKLQSLHASRLKKCEEDAEREQQAALAEREQLKAEWEKERTALTGERDQARKQAEDQAAQIATLTEQKKACDAERATCVTERDRCREAVYDPPTTPASDPPRPGPIASPSPGGTVSPGPAPQPSQQPSQQPQPQPQPQPSPQPQPPPNSSDPDGEPYSP